jgi:pyruvate,water dikinase
VLTYCAQLAVSAELPIHAVLIQKMVDTAICGIFYTSNPLAQEQMRMVITATQGLEKGIVSRIVPADEYKVTLDEAREPILRRQNIKDALGEEGGTKIVPMIHKHTQLVLYHSDIYRWAQIALPVEFHYQEPRYTERGTKIYNRGEPMIYAFQARLVTTRTNRNL